MTTKYSTNDLGTIIQGLDKAANIVRSTMGGQGKTVVIATDNVKEELKFTKDGVSVAESISFPNELENIGAKILISAAQKTVETCGDGTTLTSVLLQALLKEVSKEVKNKKDINKVLRDVEYDISKIINSVHKKTIEVKNTKDIYNIAKTSSNSERIGKLFQEIYEETGLDALITLQKSDNSLSTYYDVTKGIQYNNGYAHPAFMTDKDINQAIYEDAYIHLSTQGINSLTEEYQALISDAMKEEIPLIIIAPSFSDAFLRTCVMNKVNKAAKLCLIKSPGYGANIKRNLEDMQAFISESGYVDKVVITDRTFTLFNKDHSHLEERLERIKSLEESAQDELDRQNYLARYYKLKNATAIIYAGGITKVAMKEEYDRLEDAIGATKTAIDHGYVEGGGITFFRIAEELPLKNYIKKVLRTPFTQILHNANISKINVDLNDIKGYNVKTHTYENFLETGILDPSHVLITSLLNAFTNTKLLLNTSYVLYNEYNDKIN